MSEVTITPVLRTIRADRRLIAALTDIPELRRYLENLGLDIRVSIPDAVQQNSDIAIAAQQTAEGAQSTANAALDGLRALAEELQLLDVPSKAAVSALQAAVAALEQASVDVGQYAASNAVLGALARSVDEVWNELEVAGRRVPIAILTRLEELDGRFLDSREAAAIAALARKLDELEALLLDLDRAPIIPGAYVPQIVDSTSAYTVDALPPENPTTVRADATGAAFTVTMPASPRMAQMVNVKKIDATANTVTVDGNGKNIDGTATKAISTQYTNLQLQFNGATWDLL